MDIKKLISTQPNGWRETTVSTIASQLVGVQPMTAPAGQIFTMRHGRVSPLFTLAKNQDACLRYPGEHYVVNVKPQVDAWLTDQPCDMWMNTEMTPELTGFEQYIVSAELYTLMILKWGGQ